MNPPAPLALIPALVFATLAFAGLLAWLAWALRALRRAEEALAVEQESRNLLTAYARSQGYQDGRRFTLRSALRSPDSCRHMIEISQAALAVHLADEAPPADAA